MAYEANQRHDDCIDLYEQLEKRHPSISIRRQAAELKYILEAPKLKISQEEMVTIPLLNSYDRLVPPVAHLYSPFLLLIFFLV